MSDQETTHNAGEAPPHLTLDYALYESLLDDSDLSEEQKRELIETLWNIVISFVDLGFGFNPVQLICEQNRDIAENLAENLLSSKSDNQNNTQQDHALETRSSGQKREDS
jgi:hypothetical protein